MSHPCALLRPRLDAGNLMVKIISRLTARLEKQPDIAIMYVSDSEIDTIEHILEGLHYSKEAIPEIGYLSRPGLRFAVYRPEDLNHINKTYTT